MCYHYKLFFLKILIVKTKRSRPAKKLKILEYETKRNDKIREELPILTKVEIAKLVSFQYAAVF